MIVAARSGMGVAIIPPCLVEHELSSGELVCPFALTASTGRGCYVCVRKSAADQAPLALFTDWIKSVGSPDTAPCQPGDRVPSQQARCCWQNKAAWDAALAKGREMGEAAAFSCLGGRSRTSGAGLRPARVAQVSETSGAQVD
jgi:LysR substrate binding domain